MPILVRSLLMLSTILMLAACAPQKGLIERPQWVREPAWDSSGLSVAGYGASDYSTSVKEESLLAEENALKKTRRLLARELAQRYLAYLSDKKEALPNEDDAAAAIERVLGNLQVNKKYYDEQRRVYFLQLYLPTHRVAEILKAAFGVEVQASESGQLK